MHLMHGVWTEIVQRDDACNDRSECGGDLRVADVSNVLLAFHNEMVNFGLEGLAHLSGGPREVDEHAAGINHLDAETVRFEPGGDGVEIGFRHTESFAELLRSKPVMEIRRTSGMEFIKEFLKGLLLFRGALQLQKHMRHREIVGHRAAVVCKHRFGARVAPERDTIHFINGLRDTRGNVPAGFCLGKSRRRTNQDGDDNCGEEPRFAKHGSPSYAKTLLRQTPGTEDGNREARSRGSAEGILDGRVLMGRELLLGRTNPESKASEKRPIEVQL